MDLAPAGIGVDLGAVERHRAQLEHPYLARQFQHLHEQPFDLLEKAPPKRGTPPNRTSHAPAAGWKTRLWRSRKPECPTAVLGDRTPIPCPDSSGSSPTGQARQSPQRRTAPDVAPEASHPPTAAEGTQSRGQSCGNCSKACHPVRKKGRINAKILPNPAKSDRLLESWSLETWSLESWPPGPRRMLINRD